jgi:hypothetical protein
MKKSIVLLPLLLSTSLFAQNKLTITENTLKISALTEEVFYFGFDEGDDIIFSFSAEKELKGIEIFEYSSSYSLYTDYKVLSINEKTLHVSNKGIYGFRFSNEALAGRVCKFKIERVPKEGGNLSFNSTVIWKEVSDTTYTTENEEYVQSRDTSVVHLINQTAKVSSKNAVNGNPNKTLVDFVLPTNTISWSYYIGVGSEGQQAYDAAESRFINSVADVSVAYGGTYGAMISLALNGYSYFKKVQGIDNVQYYFITDYENVKLFWTDNSFYQYKQGNVTNDASQMKAPLSGKIYIGLYNDNVMDPIDVLVKVTAIVVENKYAIRQVQKMHVKTRREPYLKQ